nr:maltoporin [Raoultella sp. NCTC 9187]
MKIIKKLPLAMAVIAALCPLSSVMAQDFTQEQIDAIVAKAVDKALADRQAKMDAAAAEKGGSGNQPATAAATPDMAIPFGLKFSGYARYGAQFQTAIRSSSASTAPTTARRPSAVSATKVTAANSR